MLSRKYGAPGLVALALLLGAGLFSAGCSNKDESKGLTKDVQKEHTVRLKVETSKGEIKAMAHPETLSIKGYKAHDKIGHSVTWTFKHQLTKITLGRVDGCTTVKGFEFKCPKDPKTCGDECTLEVPDDIVFTRAGPCLVKYNVDGSDGGPAFKTNDPDIEIDR